MDTLRGSGCRLIVRLMMDDITESSDRPPARAKRTATPRSDRFTQLLDEEREKDPKARPGEIARRALSRLHAERKLSADR